MQVRRSVLEIPDRMMDQETTRFLSEIEGGIPIRPKIGMGSSGKSRYGVGSGSTETIDEGGAVVERRAIWGSKGTKRLAGETFRGSKNFPNRWGRTFRPDGRKGELVGSES